MPVAFLLQRACQ